MNKPGKLFVNHIEMVEIANNVSPLLLNPSINGDCVLHTAKSSSDEWLDNGGCYIPLYLLWSYCSNHGGKSISIFIAIIYNITTLII